MLNLTDWEPVVRDGLSCTKVSKWLLMNDAAKMQKAPSGLSIKTCRDSNWHFWSAYNSCLSVDQPVRDRSNPLHLSSRMWERYEAHGLSWEKQRLKGSKTRSVRERHPGGWGGGRHIREARGFHTLKDRQKDTENIAESETDSLKPGQTQLNSRGT